MARRHRRRAIAVRSRLAVGAPAEPITKPDRRRSIQLARGRQMVNLFGELTTGNRQQILIGPIRLAVRD